jgi:hypothetical protein
MNKFSDDLLLNIYSYLDINNIVKLSYMNKYYNNLSHTVNITDELYECNNYNTYKFISKYWSKISFSLGIRDATKIDELDKPQNIYNLDLTLSHIMATPKLSDVYKVDLSFCKFLTDVSGLNGVSIVILRGCNKLVNVSPLCNSLEVDLSHCYNVTNINMLSKLHNLNISFCYKIIDISSLYNLYKLTVSKDQYIGFAPFTKYILFKNNICYS